MNGVQLYGLRRLWATLGMGRHPALKGVGLKKRLALNFVGSKSKLTRLDGRLYSNTFAPYYPSRAYDRFLRGVLAVGRGEPTPLICNFAVTPRCCCNCWHCSFADRSRRDELSLGELQGAIRQVQDLGAAVIGITGGEPLLRDDLEDIIAAIGPRSMPLLFTTGFRLERERVRALKEAGLGIPVISLDHYKPEIHDRGRNVKGMFDHALQAIRLFREEGFYVAVSFVPSRELVDQPGEMFKVIEFFKELGVNDMRLTSPILAGKLTAHPEELLSPEQVATVWQVQRKCTRTPGYPGVFAYDYFEDKSLYGCGAGYNYLFIDSQGNACPCDFTMMSLGNIKDEPLERIWRRMSGLFRRPGLVCYANAAAPNLAQRRPEHWPVPPEVSRQVVAEVPPYEPGKLPEFYRRMGLDQE